MRVALAIALWALGAIAAAAAEAGVVVEGTREGFAAHEAGLQPDDLLLRWRRAATPPTNPLAAEGALRTPFEVLEVEWEQGPRGLVTLGVRRGFEDLWVEMPPGQWGLTARPQLDEPRLERYSEAMARLEEGELAEGEKAIDELVSAAEAGGEHALAAFFAWRAASVLTAPATWEAANGLRARALAAGRADGSEITLAWLLQKAGEAWLEQSDLDAAERALAESLMLRQEGERLTEAISRTFLGGVARFRGDPVAAERLMREAWALTDRQAPGSLLAAFSLNNLGYMVADRGDLAAAEDLFSRSWEIWKVVQPTSIGAAWSLNNLGAMVDERGDLARAEALYLQALAINETVEPGGLESALNLNGLGALAAERGDLAAAEDYQRRSLEIRERLVPGTFYEAQSLVTLAATVHERGAVGEAATLARRALAIRESLGPDGVEVAGSLEGLAEQALDREDLAAADTLLQRALEIRNRTAPRSLELASCHALLGRADRQRGDLAGAARHQRLALEIRSRLAPGSVKEAESLHSLASIARQRGRNHEALAHYARAIEALESQEQRLGGTAERRTGFRARYIHYYRDYAELLLEVGRADEAFEVLERSRAQGLLALLRERELVFTADLPPELDRERRVMAVEVDRVLDRLLALEGPGSEAEERALATRLRELRRQQADLRGRIKEVSPRLASLTQPQPLDLAATLDVLEPGTLLVTYAIGRERSHGFALDSAAGLSVFLLERGEEEVGALVERFRRLLQRPRGAGDAAVLVAETLTRLLLGPVAPRVEAARRIVVVPDGPLHLLPFAALRDPNRPGKRYFVEAKPFSVVASAAVLAELASRRQAETPDRLVAFGDPVYPGKPGGGDLPAVQRGGLRLAPLPASRREVEDLGALYGDRAVLWLGLEATEERAKALDRDVSMIHLAAHGLINERSPLESALALSIPIVPGGDNGLLQAWEILEQMRIEAELVTLSACETALGGQVAGEGIVGLTRAFQYAGARTVLASLWRVEDESTAELMRRFYGHLEAGLSKAEALQAAQLDLLRAPLHLADGSRLDASHPYHWAAFQLFGDWQ